MNREYHACHSPSLGRQMERGVDYLPQLGDDRFIEQGRRQAIIVAAGGHAFLPHATQGLDGGVLATLVASGSCVRGRGRAGHARW